MARGGVPEFYQGLGITLVGSMPSVGVYFGLYQYVKKQMDARKDMSPYISITVSAGVGNFIARYVRITLMHASCEYSLYGLRVGQVYALATKQEALVSVFFVVVFVFFFLCFIFNFTAACYKALHHLLHVTCLPI